MVILDSSDRRTFFQSTTDSPARVDTGQHVTQSYVDVQSFFHISRKNSYEFMKDVVYCAVCEVKGQQLLETGSKKGRGFLVFWHVNCC